MTYRHIETYCHYNRIGVMLELETIDDITGRTSEFKTLARDIALHIAACAPDGIEPVTDPKLTAHWAQLNEGTGHCEVLLSQSFVKDANRTVGQIVQSVENRLAARIRVVRFIRYAVD